MAVSLLPNGFGATTGNSLVTNTRAYLSGNAWYVLGTTGVDAAGNAGKNRNKPLATLAQANTNASAGDVIVFLSGHAQTLTAVEALKACIYVSEGSGTSRATFTRNHATAKLFTIASARTQLRNIIFAGDTVANSAARVEVAASECRIIDCYFNCDGDDEGPAVGIITSGDRCRIAGTTFISTATATGDQPESGLKVSNAVSDLELIECTFSGGTYGWSNQYACDLTAAAITGLYIEGVNLLLDSDIGLHASTTPTVITFGTTSGSARVVQ